MSHISSGYLTAKNSMIAWFLASIKGVALVKISFISLEYFKKSCLKIANELVDIISSGNLKVKYKENKSFI